MRWFRFLGGFFGHRRTPSCMVWICATVVLSSLAGCGPALDKKDLGTVLKDVPKAEELGTPYELPPPPKGKSLAKTGIGESDMPIGKNRSGHDAEKH